ncbi:hypothetical protein BU23DRAFT_572509 [Bimuria novae-zelandiae CBS 107.79]|uniref:Uncharacterized protein n=1 Tax=Bimuria novae-zelandiae CBS 107.79 TaxID=1447943 RepID=A0A6A5USV1_9PLEO|nr:hypothetical protein BU23DRAFT_572509 [Bimuria novae-zelandiae CBS 107.79]
MEAIKQFPAKLPQKSISSLAYIPGDAPSCGRGLLRQQHSDYTQQRRVSWTTDIFPNFYTFGIYLRKLELRIDLSSADVWAHDCIDGPPSYNPNSTWPRPLHNHDGLLHLFEPLKGADGWRERLCSSFVWDSAYMGFLDDHAYAASAAWQKQVPHLQKLKVMVVPEDHCFKE